MKKKYVITVQKDSETSKLQPVNLSEKRRDIVGVHQRVANSFQRL